MASRHDVRMLLEATLRGMPEVISAFEGGSAATGFLDEWSDLDLEAVCEDDAVEKVMATVRAALDRSFGILREYRIPEPAWHGFSQSFWLLRGTPPLYYVDFAVIRRSQPDKMTETDRHGHRVVWFERESVIAETVSSAADILARGKKLFANATAMDFLMILEARKGVARDDFAEAFSPYYRFLGGGLAVLLNLKHRPAKADFGLRYSRRDYPEADRALVEAALKVSSVAELSASLDRLVSRFEALKAELSAKWS